MRNSTATRACIATAALAAFLWTLALGVSPQLHERIHSDANRVDHSCAVTYIASGSFAHSPPALLASAPLSRGEFSIPDFSFPYARSLFLLVSVFEHAPPANS